MIPTRQTIFVASHPKGRGNCMSACLASILELPLDEVIDTTSDEVRADWHEAIGQWLGSRGLKMIVTAPDSPDLQGAYSIGTGRSPRDTFWGTFFHAVVCKNGRMVFDPHPSDDGVRSFSHHHILVALTSGEQAIHDIKTLARAA